MKIGKIRPFIKINNEISTLDNKFCFQFRSQVLQSTFNIKIIHVVLKYHPKQVSTCEKWHSSS